MAEKHYQEYDAYLQKLADGNITDGVTYEPRAFFDILPLGAAFEEVFSSQEVFRNGEEFPIVLTHLTASMALLEQDGETAQDERRIQQVGAYLKFHDQYYMNPPQTFEITTGGVTVPTQVAAPLPTWVNKNVATSEAINRGLSTWKFPKPFILSTRDSLRVEVMTPYPFNEARFVTVAFTGIGILTRQPKFLSGGARLTTNSTLAIDTEQFKNDGNEPWLITSMSVLVQPDAGDVNTVGDARSVFLRVRQIGNGTNATWFQSPINREVEGTSVQLPNSVVGAINIGTGSGRAVVHEFPRPIIWEPGEGIDVAAQVIGDVDLNASVQIALTGYIAVQ